MSYISNWELINISKNREWNAKRDKEDSFLYRIRLSLGVDSLRGNHNTLQCVMKEIKLFEVIPSECPMGKDDCIGCKHLYYFKIYQTEVDIHCDYDDYSKEDEK